MAALPLAAPLALACLGLVALLAVLVGQHRPWVVLPLTALVVVLVVRAVPWRSAAPGEARAAVVALVGAGGWAVWGLGGVGQYVVVARDPGFLTLGALWLVDHPSAPVPTGRAADVAEAVRGFWSGAEAFADVGGALHAQGSSMLPAVLAVVGWAGGADAVLAGGVLVGAVALLAVHALARELVGPWWGLLAATALALCLPMLVLTRSAYTEPLVLACVALGTALLARAVRSGSVGLAALAGAAVGVAGAARIDGAIVVAGLLVALALVVLAAPDASGRAVHRAQLRAAGAAALLLTALGYLDLVLQSPVYLAERLRYVVPLGVGLVVLGAVAALLAREDVAVRVRAALVRAARPRRPRHGGPTARSRAADAAALVVAVTAVVLLSRPWWFVGRAFAEGSATAGAVGRQQVAEGLALDPTRSYDEMTLTWAAWYLGWVAVVLGLAGAVVAVRRALRTGDRALLVVVAALLVGALPYVVRVTITPDQVWAVRRLLPVALPTLLVLAGWLLRHVWDRAAAARRAPRRGARVLVAAATAVVLAAPVVAWDGVQGVREQDGRLDEARAACAAVQDAGARRVVWVHSSPYQYLATLRVVCDVEVVQTFDAPTAAELAAVVDAWGGGPVVVLSYDRQDLAAAAGAAAVATTEVTTLARRIAGRPQHVDATSTTLWAAVVGRG